MFLISGCSLFQTKPIEVKSTVVPVILDKPQPIIVGDINISYDSSSDIYLMDRQSFNNLNVFLIDVERYIEETNMIFNLMENKEENNE
jgi:hypothetical protein